MVHFVGAGCGAADLITVRGKRLLEEAVSHPAIVTLLNWRLSIVARALPFL